MSAQQQETAPQGAWTAYVDRCVADAPELDMIQRQALTDVLRGDS